MITSFQNKLTESIWNRQKIKRGFPSDLQRLARRKLGLINDAVFLNDLRVPPGNRLEALKGNRQGQYSIRINDKWRICFRWINDNAYDVEITDYH